MHTPARTLFRPHRIRGHDPQEAQMRSWLPSRSASLRRNHCVGTQTPKTGLLVPSREVVLFADSALPIGIAAARRAEQAGYDSVWVGDSLLARPRGEPLTLLAAVAGATTRLTLGTAVLLPLLRHPVSLAHALATLDRIAKGRLVVGIGPGAELPGTHRELAALGIPSDRRVSDMLTGVERCKRLWRNEEPGIELPPKPFR